MTVETKTLDQIILENRPPEIHFLKIDVEGPETAVLNSIQLNKYRPWIILIESIYPCTTKPTYPEWDRRSGAYKHVCEHSESAF